MKKYSLLWIIVLVIITLFLYHGILYSYPVSDEYVYWKYFKGSDFLNSLRIFLPPELGGYVGDVYYRPVVSWTKWLDSVVFSFKPLYFRLASLFFHSINIVLIGLLAFYSFRNKKAVVLASILFSVFPFHSEAVIYSWGGRDNVIVTIFYLLSFFGVIRFVETKKIIWIVTTCTTFLLALMTHESAVTLPVSIFLFLFVHEKLTIKKIYIRYKYFFLLFFFVFLFYFIIRSIVLSSINPYSLVDYMSRSFTINNVFRLYSITLAFLLILRFFAKSMFKIFSTKEHIFWFYWIVLGVLFLPTFYIPTQERHLYLPSFAFVLAVCSILMSLDIGFSKKNPWMRKIFWASTLCVILLSGVFLMQRIERWTYGTMRAEKMSKEIARVIKKSDTEKKFYFINSPDSINGVYVYRLRMNEAIEYSLGRTITQEFIVTPQIFGEKSDIKVIDKNSLVLKSDEGFMMFLPELSSDGKLFIKTDEFIATQLDARTLHIDFIKEEFDIRKSNIFLFQNGNVVYKPYSKYEKTKD